MGLELFLTEVFLRNALLGGTLVSIACGIIGPFVHVKKIGYVAGGISHSILGGMGIFYYLGWDPMVGALVTAVIASLTISWVSLNAKDKEDVIISTLWAGGMALGVLFIAKSPGYSVDLTSYLFGNILMLSDKSLYMTLAIVAAVGGAVLLFYRPLVAVAFDPEFARVRGIKVGAYTSLLYLLIGLTVVVLIQLVGLILVIALLTIPAQIARGFSKSIWQMVLIACALGVSVTALGLMVSFQLDIPVGATIVLTTIVVQIIDTIRKSFSIS